MVGEISRIQEEMTGQGVRDPRGSVVRKVIQIESITQVERCLLLSTHHNRKGGRGCKNACRWIGKSEGRQIGNDLLIGYTVSIKYAAK